MQKRLTSVSIHLLCLLVFVGIVSAELNSPEERERATASTEQPRVGATPDDRIGSPNDAHRGDLLEIQAAHYGTCRNSSDSNTSDTTFEDTEVPGTGDVFGYLVIGVGQAGDRGRAGFDSDGSERDLRAKDCI